MATQRPFPRIVSVCHCISTTQKTISLVSCNLCYYFLHLFMPIYLVMHIQDAQLAHISKLQQLTEQELWVTLFYFLWRTDKVICRALFVPKKHRVHPNPIGSGRYLKPLLARDGWENIEKMQLFMQHHV